MRATRQRSAVRRQVERCLLDIAHVATQLLRCGMCSSVPARVQQRHVLSEGEVLEAHLPVKVKHRTPDALEGRRDREHLRRDQPARRAGRISYQGW